MSECHLIILIQENEGRQTDHIKLRRDLTVQVQQHWKRNLEGFYKRFDLWQIPRPIHIDADEPDSPVFELDGKFDQFRDGADTWRSPGCPEIDYRQLLSF